MQFCLCRNDSEMGLPLPPQRKPAVKRQAKYKGDITAPATGAGANRYLN
jgi:hypothetical protein